MQRALLAAASLLATARALDNGVAQVPPLAWSSWNYFNDNISHATIAGIGKALVSTGLAGVGYTQVNVDAGWLTPGAGGSRPGSPGSCTRGGNRTAGGILQPDAKKFPKGMLALANELNAMDLKLGLVSACWCCCWCCCCCWRCRCCCCWRCCC